MKRSKKRKNKSNKKLLLLALLVLVVGIGFAALQKTLQINGNASIDSNFDVRITNISKESSEGTAYEKVIPSYTGTTATFDVGLIAPGDSMTYKIEVANWGNFNAKLDSMVLDQQGSSNINYEVTGIENGNIIAATGAPELIYVKVTYVGTNASDTNTTKEAKLTLSFVQTSESTTEQEEVIDAFESSVSGSLNDYRTIGGSVTGNELNIKFDYGDSQYMPNFDIYNADGVLFLEDAAGKNIPINFYTEISLKTKDTIRVNGNKYSNQFSDIKTFYFGKLNDIYVINRYDGTNWEISGLLDEGINLEELTLPLGYKVKVASLNSSSVKTVIIPSGYNLSQLEHSSLINYDYVSGTASTNNITKVINLTGESIDWAPILGVNTDVTCEFETGTCGSVTITNVE